MPCPSCGATEARTQILPGYWRCDAVVVVGELVPAPAAGTAASAARAEQPGARRCGAIYPQAQHADSGPGTCRCGDPAVGECSECTRPVCSDHSDLWRGWRVCDRDLATARIKARAFELAEQKRVQEAAAAAKAESERQRNTLLDLSGEEALWLLYVEEQRTEQEIRSATHVLRGLKADAFTRLCLDVLPAICAAQKGRRKGLSRPKGWSFAGPDYHDRSWFLTRKGEWFRSGSYGSLGAETGHRGRRVRFDDTEKRAVIYEMSWQQSVDSGIA